MADQSIRVTNLPDSGSHEAVALELWKRLKPDSTDAVEQLKFFHKCLMTVRGYEPN